MKIPPRRVVALGAAALLVVAGFGWIVATQGPLAPVKVTVMEAREAALPQALFGIGTVEARRSFSLGPTVASRVAAVAVDHGDAVAPGQLLAEMDPVDLDERLRAAAAAAARTGELVRSAAAAVAEADSRAALARANASRFADLQRRHFVSREAADARQHEANAAEAALAGARASLDAARDEQRRAAADRAGVAKARAQLRLTSPVAGVVTARLAEPGTTLVAGQAVLQLIDPASLWVRARIDQARSAGLAVGAPVKIVLRSQPDAPLAGRIARVDLLGDAVTEERIVYASIDAPPPGVSLGELAEIEVTLPTLPRALVVPAAAVKRVGASAGVWLLRDGQAAFQAVTVGAAGRDGMAQVLGGLAAGAQVIVHSSRPLAADARVKIVDRLAGT